MNLSIYAPLNNTTSKCWQVFSPLLEGGWPDARVVPPEVWNDDPCMFWGFRHSNFSIYQRCLDTNRTFFFSDMPYSNRWAGPESADHCAWRIIKDDVHLRTFIDRPMDRALKFNLVAREWKKNGGHILVCPSSNTMTHLQARLDQKRWVDNVVAELSKHTDRPIRVRYKPRSGKLSGPMVAEVPIEDDLKDAHAVVVSSSISAVDAALMGVPIFCDVGSFCTPVGLTDLSLIESPDRSADMQHWFNNLAYSQFTKEEMRSGLARSILTSS